MVKRRRKGTQDGQESTEQPLIGKSTDTQSQGCEVTTRPSIGFDVRPGDRLTVTYAGAKLCIGRYSTVDLDSAVYSRTLEPGDDPVEQWDLIYEYLRNNAIKNAKEKLHMFVEELTEVRKRVC